MLNKKGFTLIELLAVIVILAVIALIAVPIILNVIENAKEGSFKDSVYGAFDALELHIGKLEIDNQEIPDTINVSDLSYKGEQLTGHFNISNNGELIEAVDISNGSYTANGYKEDLIIVKKDVTYITKVVTGGNHNLAIDNKGNLYAWGRNDYGQLGFGYVGEPVLVPTKVETTEKFVDIAATVVHSLALTADGRLFSWGRNTYGQVGNGSTGGNVLSITHVATDKTFKKIAPGYYHSFAIGSDNKLYGFGRNSNNELGNGASTASVSTPKKLSEVDFKEVSGSAENYGAAIDINGKLYTWGKNVDGQLGNGLIGTDKMVSIPTLVAEDLSFKKVEVGTSHVVAIGTDGYLYTWGSAISGRLGNNTTTGNVLVPTKLDTTVTFKNISVGSNFAIAHDINDDMYTFGNGSSGLTGSLSNILVPTLVNFNNKIRMVSVNSTAIIALDKSNNVYTMGDNTYGQIGNNTVSAPVTTSTLINVIN